jgi:hypothetical protein
MVAVHPTVQYVTIRADGLPDQRVATTPLPDDPAGPRYAVAALPEDTGHVTVSASTAGEIAVLDDIDLSELGN